MKYLVIILLLFLVSCDYIWERQKEKQAQENYVSPFQGIWVGKYNGDEKGDLTIKVAKNGSISFIRSSEHGITDDVTNGLVRDDSALQSVSSLQSGFTLFGNLQQKSGTWKMGDWKGNWSVTKQ